eukprot:scaffold48320_cov29-Phaeocystis_antarctica.AAC.1
MVNSLPNAARQLARLGMVSGASLRALLVLCSERDSVLEDIVAYYGLFGQEHVQLDGGPREEGVPDCSCAASRKGLQLEEARKRRLCAR